MVTPFLSLFSTIFSLQKPLTCLDAMLQSSWSSRVPVSRLISPAEDLSFKGGLLWVSLLLLLPSGPCPGSGVPQCSSWGVTDPGQQRCSSSLASDTAVPNSQPNTCCSCNCIFQLMTHHEHQILFVLTCYLPSHLVSTFFFLFLTRGTSWLRCTSPTYPSPQLSSDLVFAKVKTNQPGDFIQPEVKCLGEV